MATNLRKNTWGLDENYAEVEAGKIGYYDEGEAFEMWGWGKNEQGEIPVNTHDSYSSPRQIPGTWNIDQMLNFKKGFGALKYP